MKVLAEIGIKHDSDAEFTIDYTKKIFYVEYQKTFYQLVMKRRGNINDRVYFGLMEEDISRFVVEIELEINSKINGENYVENLNTFFSIGNEKITNDFHTLLHENEVTLDDRFMFIPKSPIDLLLDPYTRGKSYGLLLWFSFKAEMVDLLLLKPPEVGETVGGVDYEQAKRSFEKRGRGTH
jgi:hypothetical protein